MHGQPNHVPPGDFANVIVAQALQHVRDGHPKQAIAALTSRGEASLDNAFACNLLGLLYSTEGADEKALECFDRTLRLGQSTPDVLGNRAFVLQRLGRLEAAIASYDESLRFRPDDPNTLHGRGTALHRAERFAEALACYDAVLRIRPSHAEALARRGDVLQELGRPAEALAAYENALRSNGRDAALLYQHGNVLRSLGRPAQALNSYRAALEADPGHVGALCGCARCLLDSAAFDRALAYCDAALRLAPDSFAVHALRANILSAAGQSAPALEAYDRALAIEPHNPMALCNRTAALRELGRLDEALASIDGALRLRPDYPEALSNRGVVLRELGRFAEALEAFDASLALRPDFPHALNNKSVLLLLLGDFENGWKSYGGYASAPEPQRNGPCPEWPGVSTLAKGLRLLVADEHGLGDCIQFGRYLPQLVAAGADVTVVCRPAMQRVLQPLFEGVRVLDKLDGAEPFDYRVGFAGLPRAYLADPQTIPAHVPYLRAEPALVARWSKALGQDGFKIGIAWQGNPKLDPARAIPLRCFARLAAPPGVRLISLQRFDGLEQLADLPPAMRVETLADFDVGEDAFIDSAAVIESLDLVIACDTSLAHLAGALGRPVWVALRQVPEWRWLFGRDDSPWYPTMRLFRQSERGDWDAVFERMAEALARSSPA